MAKEAKKVKEPKSKALDQATARKLHEAGKTDAEIAKEYGLSEDEAKRTRKRG